METPEPYLIAMQLRCNGCLNNTSIRSIYISSEFSLGIDAFCQRCGKPVEFVIPLEELGAWARDAKDKQTQEQFASSIELDDKAFLSKLKIKPE